MRISGAFEMRSLRVTAYSPTLINFICLFFLSHLFLHPQFQCLQKFTRTIFLPLFVIFLVQCYLFFKSYLFSKNTVWKCLETHSSHFHRKQGTSSPTFQGAQGIRKTYLIPRHSVRKMEGYTVTSKCLSPVGLCRFSFRPTWISMCGFFSF